MALAPKVVIQFTFGSRELTLDYRKISAATWSELKAVLGLTPQTVVTSLADWDIDAVGAVIWLERKQRERKLGWRAFRDELEGADEDRDFQITEIIARDPKTGRWRTIDGEIVEDPAEAEDPTDGS